MRYQFFFLPLILTFMTFLPAASFAQYEVKDSFYFMKGDGEFSDEEKDEEAQYVFEQCQNNSIQNIYFDCACLAGALRVERDKEKLMPQSNIINSILTDDSRGCANTVAIAGETYEFCSEYARVFRSRQKDNAGYCKCVANDVANNFKKNPVMRRDNIEKLRGNALSNCRKKS